MKVIVSGAAGYLGSRVAAYLASGESPLRVTELVLVDVAPPAPPAAAGRCRITSLALDLAAPGAAGQLLDSDCAVMFHLAAVVSGQAEAEFDLGLRVNFDATRHLLEAARRVAPALVFVYTSTVGVFGGELPAAVGDGTAVTPETSYGCAKAMSELLVNEYARRGFVDARAVRLPTVAVRAGAANRAVTSFASAVVREPLAGLPAACPVPAEQRLWLAGPRSVVRNVVHAATLPAAALGTWRVVALPGFCVSVAEMVAALREVAGERAAALVHFRPDAELARMVASFPTKFDNSRALRLGFVADTDFADVIRSYIKDDLKQ